MMMVTPEQKREINRAILRALKRILAEEKERFCRLDIIEHKNFDVNFGLNMHPPQERVAIR